MSIQTQQKCDVPQLIEPPNELRAKVTGSGAMDEQMEKQVKIAMRKHELHYPQHAMKQLVKLGNFVHELRQHLGTARVDDLLQDIYKISHCMRGEGGCYGFPLITNVANSLCEFVEVLDDVREQKLITIIDAHCQTLNIIIRKNIKDDGGQTGKEIFYHLTSIVENYLKENGLFDPA